MKVYWSIETMSVSKVIIKDRAQSICQNKKFALDVDPEVTTIFFSKFEVEFQQSI